MKKTILLLLFINLYLAAYNQIIKGTVHDRETNYPIDYATIYFEGTSISSFTDAKGDFKLDKKIIASMPLTIIALIIFRKTNLEF